MAPSTRRRVSPAETLSARGAAPLFLSCITTGPKNRSSASEDGVGANEQEKESDEEDEIIGVSIGGWEIVTRNSTIANEAGMDGLTVDLERFASPSVASAPSFDDGVDGDCGGAGASKRTRKRLCPPEITFLDAIVSFQYGGRDDVEKNVIGIRFAARDALMEWAEAHRALFGNDDQGHSRGVCILRTANADAWSRQRMPSISTGSKRRTQGTTASSAFSPTAAAAASPAETSEFYYDWTFSSPYAGTVVIGGDNGEDGNDGDRRHALPDAPPTPITVDNTRAGTATATTNRRHLWKSLPSSGIDFSLLRDTSQPILLYDDVSLYDDDLHDNGDVSLNVKVRVMPTCWYALCRLYVRVDHVSIRVKETRMFCPFPKNNDDDENSRTMTVYRDVVWREASWETLSRMGLPVDPKVWREESGETGISSAAAAATLAGLLARLPKAPLPSDLHAHSVLEVVRRR